MVNHLLRQSFLALKADRTLAKRLLGGDETLLSSIAQAELPESFMVMDESLLLTAPAHVCHMAWSMRVIFNEMCLPTEQRTGPPLAIPAHHPGRTPTQQHCVRLAAPVLTPEEDALAKLIRKFKTKGKVTVKDANTTLTKKSGYRSNQQKLASLFDLAQEMGVGRREGEPGGGLVLHFTLATTTVEVRQRLGVSAECPSMMNGGAVGDRDFPATTATATDTVPRGGTIQLRTGDGHGPSDLVPSSGDKHDISCGESLDDGDDGDAAQAVHWPQEVEHMATLECAETRSGRLHAALACQSTCAQSSGVNASCASTQGKARTLRLRSKSKHPHGSTTSESLGALVPRYEICIPQGSNVDTSAGSSAGLVTN